MLQTIDMLTLRRLTTKAVIGVGMAIAVATAPAVGLAQDQSASETRVVDQKTAATYQVYAWNCSRSMNQVGTYQDIQEACQVAQDQSRHSTNVRIVIGELESVYMLLRYNDSQPASEYLVYRGTGEGRWELTASLKQAEHAQLIQKSIIDGEGIAQMVVRY